MPGIMAVASIKENRELGDWPNRWFVEVDGVNVSGDALVTAYEALLIVESVRKSIRLMYNLNS